MAAKRNTCDSNWPYRPGLVDFTSLHSVLLPSLLLLPVLARPDALAAEAVCPLTSVTG